MTIRDKQLAVIGCGSLGGALVAGLLRQGHEPRKITATRRDLTKLEDLAARGVVVTDNNKAASAAADVIVLAVRPSQMASVLAELAAEINKKQVPVVSVAAGLTLETLAAKLQVPLLRAMPNIASALGQGVTIFQVHDSAGAAKNAAGDAADPAGATTDSAAAAKNGAAGDAAGSIPTTDSNGAASDSGDAATVDLVALAEELFAPLGLTLRAKSSAEVDSFTALCGCGPAYFFYFVKALSDYGLARGLPPAAVHAAAVQTVKGAAALMEKTDRSPEELINQVAAPGEQTATRAALDAMQAAGLAEIIKQGCARAEARAAEMGKEIAAAMSSAAAAMGTGAGASEETAPDGATATPMAAGDGGGAGAAMDGGGGAG